MENGLPDRTRWLDIAPGRLPAWLDSFADRHGGLAGPPQYSRRSATPDSDPASPVAGDPPSGDPPLAGDPDAGDPEPGRQGSGSQGTGRQVQGSGRQGSGSQGSGRQGSGVPGPTPSAGFWMPDHPASVVVFRAADGAVAECHVPFPPLPAPSGDLARDELVGREPGASAARMAAHAMADRTVGVLLVRLGGYAAGVFTGTDQHLVVSKVGSRLVHGRSAAGGQSQRRFARRREKQASEALGAAADTAAGVFGPYSGKLDAVVLGGDKRAMSGLADDPRLRSFLDLAVDRFLTVPDPRLVVLKGTPRLFTAIRIRLSDPATATAADGPATS